MAAPIASRLFCKRILATSLFNSLRSVRVCQQRWMSKEIKKFYKTASISLADGFYEINLDQRKLRTPNGNLFRVPSEPLAFAVATEWNAQDRIVKKHTMPLTSLCNTAIDNPEQKSRNQIIKAILHYLETDTVSFRVAFPEDLSKFQTDYWDPVIRWVEERYGFKVPVTTDLIAAPDLPEKTVDILERHFESHSDWSLMGYWNAAQTVKSVVLVLALMDKHLTVEQCVKLSRLEQEYQIQKWGNVEWEHDVDLYLLQSRVAAAALFVQWNNENFTVKKKASISEMNI